MRVLAILLTALWSACASAAEDLSGFIDMAGSRPGVGNGSAMFYWFTPAQNGGQDSPLLVWLQGKYMYKIPAMRYFLNAD